MDIIKRFFSYTEIKTKITSVLTFGLTLAYLLSSGREINVYRSFVFFLGMFLFDLTATTVNNYCDTKKNHQTLQFSRRTALAITLILFAASTLLGLYLVYLTDLFVLFLGGLCFLLGILYSYGPVPISHGPYGEVISGLFYGLLIPTLLFYINLPNGELLSYSLSLSKFSFELNFAPALEIALLSVVPFCLTANIMLANNTCDVKHDVAVNRYTLPYYLKDNALRLFAALYYAAYVSVVIMVFLKLLSPMSLLLLVTLLPVQKNINRFRKRQLKEETFASSIKNFILIILVHTVLILLGCLLPGWGPR